MMKCERCKESIDWSPYIQRVWSNAEIKNQYWHPNCYAYTYPPQRFDPPSTSKIDELISFAFHKGNNGFVNYLIRVKDWINFDDTINKDYSEIKEKYIDGWHPRRVADWIREKGDK